MNEYGFWRERGVAYIILPHSWRNTGSSTLYGLQEEAEAPAQSWIVASRLREKECSVQHVDSMDANEDSWEGVEMKGRLQ